MKRVFVGIGVATMASAGVFSVSAFRRDVTIRPNTVVAGVKVGELKPEEAQFKLRAWWEGERVKKLILKNPHLLKGLPGMTPGQLGVTFDDVATVAQLPMQDFWQDMTNQEGIEERYEPVYKTIPVDYTPLRKIVKEAVPPPRPARAVLVSGVVRTTPEVSGFELDEAQIPSVVEASVKEGQGVVQLPIKEADKTIPDQQLAEITAVVQSFSTRFPRNPNRNNNIRLAAAKLNGVVIAPGHQMSFNETVGRRTIEGGFKEAGVYRDGRHDTGVGGGICQVSTTLYNASLLSNVKIAKRQNHSMPVAYVPLGRDATVNYGTHDFVIENNYDTPIAISSTYEPGRLTFRILGKPVPGLKVKIERYGEKSWGTPTKTVVDRSLPPGTRKVVERGTIGRSIFTTRLVYINGQLVKREPLGKSYYAGGKRIIAVGPPRPKVEESSSPEPSASEPAVVVGQ